MRERMKFAAIAVVVSFVCLYPAQAQWVSSGSSGTTPIYYSGNVGVGVTAQPGDRLAVQGGPLAFYDATGYPYVGLDYDSVTDTLRFRANYGGTTLNREWFFMKRETGRIGIGTSNPGDKLSIQGGALSFHNPTNPVPYAGMDYDETSDTLRLRTNIGGVALNSSPLSIQRQNGRVDIGTWSGMPGNVSGVKATVDGDAFIGVSTARARISSNSAQGFFQWNLYWNGASIQQMDTSKPGYELDMNAGLDKIAFRRYATVNGTLTSDSILSMTRNGTSYDVAVNGTLTATRVIGATYQDIAEWVPATTPMRAGTVVVLNPEGINEVMPSASSYDTSVAGVVSEQPGVVLGVAGDSKAQIATYGRVKVRVDATRTPIRVGDLLVTSDKPGVAMRSEPMQIGGRSFHQPGTIIGKALEPLKSGEGEILVLLSLQ